MSPRMDADFDWGGVPLNAPIYPKGDYELEITGVRGAAWQKTDKHGNPMHIVEKIALICKMVGVVDSKGKLKKEQDGKDIAGKPVEDFNLWTHSEGGRKSAKGSMMAILGYNPRELADEEKFIQFLKDNTPDLSFESKENEAGDGYVLILGDSWEQLFVGKNVRCSMEPGVRQREGADDVPQQEMGFLSPVN